MEKITDQITYTECDLYKEIFGERWYPEYMTNNDICISQTYPIDVLVFGQKVICYDHLVF